MTRLKYYMLALVAFCLSETSAGFKCHLGGYNHQCCENDGEGPQCYYDYYNGCNQNSLNLSKKCDGTR